MAEIALAIFFGMLGCAATFLLFLALLYRDPWKGTALVALIFFAITAMFIMGA